MLFSKSHGQENWILQPKCGKNVGWEILGKKNKPGSSAGDLFEMVKTWPFQRLSDPQRLGIKRSLSLNHLEHTFFEHGMFLQQKVGEKKLRTRLIIILNFCSWLLFPKFTPLLSSLSSSCWTLPMSCFLVVIPTVDGSEIPNNHLGWWENLVNNGR